VLERQVEPGQTVRGLEFRSVTVDDFHGDTSRFQRWRGAVGLSPDRQRPAGDPDRPDAIQAAARAPAAPESAATDEGDAARRSDGDPKLPQKMSLQPSQSAASYTKQRKLSPSQYYGIDIHAKKLLFVSDRSGSMNPRVGYHTRIARAKRELIAAIDGLTNDFDFSILVFDQAVRAWREELVPATEENKRYATRFVQRLDAGSKTNTHGALWRSLQFDHQLEAVFLLTDGQPTCGRITDPATILLDVRRQNETRHVTINTIAIAVDPLMEGFLQKLAQPSGGEYRSVR